MRLEEDGRWLPGAAKQITKINVIERKRQREGPERKERRPSPSELHRSGEGGGGEGPAKAVSEPSEGEGPHATQGTRERFLQQ